MRYLVLIFMLMLAGSVQGTVWRVAKEGTSVSGDWVGHLTTIVQVNDSVSAGDTVLFGTGTWWANAEECIDPPSGGDATHQTIYACSSFVESTNAARLAGRYLPTICGGEQVTGWIQHSGSVYKAEWNRGNGWPYDPGEAPSPWISTAVCMLTQDDSTIALQGSNGSAGSISDVDAAGKYHWENCGDPDTIYAWVYGGDDPDGYTMIASSGPAVTFSASSDAYIKLWGLRLTHGRSGCVAWGGEHHTNNIRIEHCYLEYSGHTPGENHAGIQSLNSTYGVSSESTYVVSCSLCNLSAGVETYTQEHMVIDSCKFYTDDFGVYFKDACAYFGSTDPPFTGNVVKNSLIVLPVPESGTADTKGIVFYNAPDRDSAYGNIIIGANFGIWVTESTPSCDSYEDYFHLLLFICNNTFWNVSEAFVEVDMPSGFDSCGYDWSEIKYNVCYQTRHTAYHNAAVFIGFGTVYGATPSVCDENFIIDSNIWYDTESAFDCRCLGSGGDSTRWVSTCSHGGGSFWVDPGIDSVSASDPWVGFNRSESSQEMDRTYGGIARTRFGAVEPSAAEDTVTTYKDVTITGVTIE